MNNNMMNLAKGMGTGLMAGMVVGYVGAKMINEQNKPKKKVSKAIHSFGDMIERGADFLS